MLEVVLALNLKRIRLGTRFRLLNPNTSKLGLGAGVSGITFYIRRVVAETVDQALLAYCMCDALQKPLGTGVP